MQISGSCLKSKNRTLSVHIIYALLCALFLRVCAVLFFEISPINGVGLRSANNSSEAYVRIKEGKNWGTGRLRRDLTYVNAAVCVKFMCSHRNGHTITKRKKKKIEKKNDSIIHFLKQHLQF